SASLPRDTVRASSIGLGWAHDKAPRAVDERQLRDRLRDGGGCATGSRAYILQLRGCSSTRTRLTLPGAGPSPNRRGCASRREWPRMAARLTVDAGVTGTVSRPPPAGLRRAMGGERGGAPAGADQGSAVAAAAWWPDELAEQWLIEMVARLDGTCLAVLHATEVVRMAERYEALVDPDPDR